MVHIFFLALSLAQPDVTSLKKEARALSKPAGCTQLSQCKVLPLGSKPCGGPSEYLVFCAPSTDEKALEAKAKLANEAEKAKNAANQTMGICTALAPPKLKLENGQCSAVEAKSADLPM
jgi:hypothetical protein